MTFNAAYGYSTNLAQQFANFYAVLNTTTHELLIRGDTNDADNSDDVITIFGVGPSITVSVDIGVDVPGTGAGSEFGNLPAFTTSFNSADVTSVRIETGTGDDIVNLNSINFGIPVDIDMGDDFDILNIGNGDLDSNIKGSVTVDFGNGGAESPLSEHCRWQS
jgi:hypothetical protein